MAAGARQVTGLDKARLRRGFGALALLAAFSLTALGAVLATGLPSLGTAVPQGLTGILRFTLLQALLSTLLAVGLAVPLAFALDEMRAFAGRSWIIGLFALPLSLPVIAGVIALLSLYGRNGALAGALQALGFSARPDIYGLSGILIAHVFFNLPLAARLFLNGLDTVPEAHWKLAESLHFTAFDRFRRIALPQMRRQLPGVAGLVLLLCVTSFSIVLILGGGPGAATLEVAIYQALTYDLDLGRAAALTLAQMFLVACALLAFSRLGLLSAASMAHTQRQRRYSDLSTAGKWSAAAAITAAALFVAAPLLAIIHDGLSADHARLLVSQSFIAALRTSLLFATLAAFIAVALALVFAAARHTAVKSMPSLSWVFALPPNLVLALPPIVLGAGWFILVSRFANPYSAAPYLVIAVNAAMALPFALRLIEPAFNSAAFRHDLLCESLRISGWARLRLIDFPSMRRACAAALLFAMALSFGDLGVIALFGSGGVETLPSLLFAKMGAYRSDDASGLALYLMLLTATLALMAHRLQGAEN